MSQAQRIALIEGACLQREQLSSIRRISRSDKICANSISKHVGVAADVVEAALWRAKGGSGSGYSLFCAELREREADALAACASIRERSALLAQRWAALAEGGAEREKFLSRASAARATAARQDAAWEAALSACMERTATEGVRRAKRDAAAAAEAQEQASKAAAASKAARLAASASAPSRPISAALARRNASNAALQRDLAARQARKQCFLAEHWGVVVPFASPGMRKPTAAAAAAAREPSAAPCWAALPLTEQPRSCLSNVEMRDYQLAGLNHLIGRYRAGVNTILGDEMGLGKTLQTIALLAWLKDEAKIPGPHLIVVPLSVLSNWCAELKRFAPQLKVVRLHSADAGERERLARVVLPSLDFDVVVTTFETAKSSQMRANLVSRLWWRCVVLDEGHIIKNEHSQVSQLVRRLHCEARLLLTGTPLQNNLHEFWAILNWLEPELFGSAEHFDAAFDISGSGNTNHQSQRHRVDADILGAAHKLASVFMLRRVKAEVEKRIPPKVEKKVICPLTAAQRVWYRRMLLKDRDVLSEIEDDLGAQDGDDDTAALAAAATTHHKRGWQRLQMLLMQLRKVCNHPFLIDGAEAEAAGCADLADQQMTIDESIVEQSGKLRVLDRLLQRLRSRGHRVVIFSQFTSMLNILEDYIVHRFGDRLHCRLDGSTNRVQRNIDIAAFNRAGSPYAFFLMSTRAGGLGVNLQTADTVVLYDSDWNPQADMQAMARVHRIGQTKVVHVYRLVTGGTVEERIVQRAEKKLFLDQMVNRDQLKTGEEAGEEEKPAQAGGSDMLKLLKFGAHAICNSGEDDVR